MLAVLIPTSRSLYQFTRLSSAVKRNVGRSIGRYICSSNPATRSVVQQRFALLWGRGAYDLYNSKIKKCWKELSTTTTLVESWQLQACLFIFFFIFALYTSYAPRPHNKAGLCCTTLQVAGWELHMSTDLPTKTRARAILYLYLCGEY